MTVVWDNVPTTVTVTGQTGTVAHSAAGVTISTGSGPATPSGPAGGDLSGSYPNPTVARLQGKAVDSTAPSNGQGLIWSGSNNRWEPTTLGGGSGTVTQVDSGTGLTGGPITTSGTLAVLYGVASGTACAGNDARLSDSRTPTGSASGDLSGNYPGPTVHRIHGNDMQAGTPVDLDMWQYHASATRWRHRTFTQVQNDNGLAWPPTERRILRGSSSSAAQWRRLFEPTVHALHYDDMWAVQSGHQQASGTGASLGNSAAETGRFGVVQASTGSTASGRCAYASGSLSGLYLGSGAVWFEAMVRAPSSLSGVSDTYIMFVGITDSVTTTAPVDGVYFRYSDGSGAGAKWDAITRSNNTQTSTAVGSNLVASQWYLLGILVNAAGSSVGFYLDGVLVHTETTNIPTGLTRATGWAAGIAKQAGTNARGMNIDWVVVDMEVTR